MFNFSSIRRPATIALALTASVAMVACNDKEAPKPTPAVTSVSVSAPMTMLEIGATTQATAVVSVTNNAVKTVTWTSDKDAVATVSTTGLITAVSEGTAVIKATSTADTTKFGTVTITVKAAVVNPTLTTAKINFQTADAAVPAGYTKNTGAPYSTATGIGWVTEASVKTSTPVPLDLTNNARDRKVDTTNVAAGLDPRHYTQIQMQCGTPTTGDKCLAPAQLTSGAFQHKVINGKYNVTVSVGDADKRNLNSLHSINVEGKAVITNFAPKAGDQFKVVTAEVTVTDGMMTIDADGGKNTKINFVDIVPFVAGK